MKQTIRITLVALLLSVSTSTVTRAEVTPPSCPPGGCAVAMPVGS